MRLVTAAGFCLAIVFSGLFMMCSVRDPMPFGLNKDTLYFCLQQKSFFCPACVRAVEKQCRIAERLGDSLHVAGIILRGAEDDKKIRILELQLNGFARANDLSFRFRYDREGRFGTIERVIVSTEDSQRSWRLPLNDTVQREITRFIAGRRRKNAG